MSDRDTITLPREVAYQVPLHELLESVPLDARLVIDYADGRGTAFIPVGRYCHEAATALRTHLAAEQPKHPGYVIGSHWLETAYSRICAGEAEADVLRDIGLVREEAFLTGVAHLKAENERLLEALQDIARQPEGDEDSAQAVAKAALRREG